MLRAVRKRLLNVLRPLLGLMGREKRRGRGTGKPQHNSTPTNSSNTPSASVFNDSTQPIQLLFCNKSECSIAINWLSYEGTLKKYGTVLPNGAYSISSFSTHPWVAKWSDGHSVAYMGHSAVLQLLPGGKLVVLPYAEAEGADTDDSNWQDPAWGSYQQRGSVLGMAIMAYACVQEEAVQQAAVVVQHMLRDCQPSLVARMVKAGCNIAIIGRCQVTTDIPPHHFMKARGRCEGVRDVDSTARGLGATAAVPTTSCGEENLTMVDDRRYACESILVHEFGHAVMNLGLQEDQLQLVHRCFERATTAGLYKQGCYMLENADEYFAEGCQTWFDATVRTDVNGGINTREKIKQHDPDFAQLLAEVFGDGTWRYLHTAPAVFHSRRDPTRPRRRAHAPQAAQAQAAAAAAQPGRPLTRLMAAAAATVAAPDTAAAAAGGSRKAGGRLQRGKDAVDRSGAAGGSGEADGRSGLQDQVAPARSSRHPPRRLQPGEATQQQQQHFKRPRKR